MSTSDVPVYAQKTIIGTELNGAMLQALFLGLYTIVYLETLYFYFHKKSSGSRFVIGAITLLYVCYAFYVILFWYLVQSDFTDHSDTRETLVDSISGGNGPFWPIFVTGIITFVMAAVGDAVLIWRCYTIWGGSWRRSFIPSLLLFSQIVVDLIVVIIRSVTNFNPVDNLALLVSNLIAAQSFITFATTLSATLLIAYRIYSTSKQSMFGTTRKRVKKITEILVESAAVYSLAAIAQALSIVLPGTPDTELALDVASEYTSILFLFFSGVLPTILVARVAILEYTSNDTVVIGSSAPLSGIRFHNERTQDEESQSMSQREKISIGTFPSVDRSSFSH